MNRRPLTMIAQTFTGPSLLVPSQSNTGRESQVLWFVDVENNVDVRSVSRSARPPGHKAQIRLRQKDKLHEKWMIIAVRIADSNELRRAAIEDSRTLPRTVLSVLTSNTTWKPSSLVYSKNPPQIILVHIS